MRWKDARAAADRDAERARWRNAGGAAGFDVVLGAGAAAVFVGFMLLHKLPMYLRRVGAHDAHAAHQRFANGLRDMAQRTSVSLAWEDWRGEAAWLTPNFTLGVWASASLMLVRP